MSRKWSPDNDPNWKKVEGECLKWPNQNRLKEVFQHITTGYIIIRWFNEVGVLIATNENHYQIA